MFLISSLTFYRSCFNQSLARLFLTLKANLFSQQSCDGDEDLHWRSDLLRAVAELFERERGALLAELQTSVVEAHGEAVANEEISAASRLEELERRIRSQVSFCTSVSFM